MNLILLGPPGSGKGTQSSKLVEKYKLSHISTGDILRSQVSEKTKLGVAAKVYMDKGDLVPDEITIGMLKEIVEKHLEVPGFIFDGFPRTESQAIALDKLMNKYGSQISAMISLEVEDEILINRLLERGIESGRVDDSNRKIIENRIKEYYNKTEILKKFYKKTNCFFGVNGVGEIDEITGRLEKVIESI